MKLHYASSHAELASDFFFFSLLLLRKIFLFISYMNANKKPAFTDVWCDLNIMQSSRRRRRCSFSCSSRHIRESSWVVHVKSPLDRPCISHSKAPFEQQLCSESLWVCSGLVGAVVVSLEALLFVLCSDFDADGGGGRLWVSFYNWREGPGVVFTFHFPLLITIISSPSPAIP